MQILTHLSYRQRIAALLGLVLAGLVIILTIDPIPQDPDYHIFADTRVYLGISNFYDVVSNAGFAVVGILGIFLISGKKYSRTFVQRQESWPYLIFFTAVMLISVGSAYYHLEPSNERLFWDRLPMAVAFMAFSSAVIADRIHNRLGNTWLLGLLVILGMLSLVYWSYTESQGHGDLRFYAFIQFYPVILLPVMLWLFPSHRYTISRYLGWVIVCFVLSKVLEYYDSVIFDLSGSKVSGHTLKHIVAAAGAFVVLRMLLVTSPHMTTKKGIGL